MTDEEKAPPLYEDSLNETKEGKARVKAMRDHVAGIMDDFGNHILGVRRQLGIPDPEDHKEFGRKLLLFQMGLIALHKESITPGYRVEDTHEALRRVLANPITEQPATDEELTSHIELLHEREAQVQENIKQQQEAASKKKTSKKTTRKKAA